MEDAIAAQLKMLGAISSVPEHDSLGKWIPLTMDSLT
jgi:hypothetical protein